MTQEQGNILIVDDEPAVVYTLRCILEKVGYKVSSAENLAEAEDALRATSVDVILCDMGLKNGENGTAVLKRATELQPEAGQVMLTGYASPEDIDALEAKGISVFIKPVEMGRFLPELRRIIEQKAA